MGYRFITAGSEELLVEKLDGAIYSRPVPASGLALNGKTLVFTTPSLTVTFSDSDPYSIATAVDEINAALGSNGAIRARVYGQNERTLVVTGTSGVQLSHTGTANELLGFSTDSGDPRLAGTAIDPTKIVSVGETPAQDRFFVLVAP